MRTLLLSLLAGFAGLLALAAPAAAQWAPTGGPPGGFFTDVAAPEGAVLARHPYGVLRHTAGVWTDLDLSGHMGEMLADGARVLGRGDDGLVLSLDAGATFTALPETEWNWHPIGIDGDALFATAVDSVHVSHDGGASWEAVQDSVWVTVTSAGGTQSFYVQLENAVGAVVEGDALLVAGKAYVFGGVYRLGPDDDEWVPLLQPGVPQISESVHAISLVRHDGALWFSHSAGVHRSTDGGATWTDVSAGLPAAAGYVLHAGAGGIVASTNGTQALLRWNGSGWTALPAVPSGTQDVAVGDAVHVAALAGVFVLDGSAWTLIDGAVASSPVPQVVDADAGLFVTEGGRLLRSLDRGGSWTTVLGNIGGSLVTDGAAFVANTSAGIQRSTDGGASWAPTAQPVLPATATTNRPTGLVHHEGAGWAAYGYERRAKHGVLLERYGNVFRSDDGGATWTGVSGGLPTSSAGRYPVTVLASLEGGLFAVTGSGCVGLGDGATAWTPLPCPPGTQVYDFHRDGARWLARTSSGLFVSTDTGASWTSLTAGLPTPPSPFTFWAWARLVNTSQGLLLVVRPGATAEAYRLDGDAWSALPLAFPEGIGWAGFLEGEDGTVYGGSLGRGLWVLPSLIVASGDDDARPLALEVPAPNPTAGAVRLRYALPSAGEATLAVFTTTGRRVATLAAGLHAAGSHEVVWPAAVAAGVYVVRLTTNESAVSRSVTVFR